MKKLLLLTACIGMLALTAKAADESYYKAGVSLDGFVSARTYDLNKARGGAGFGANFWFANNLGIGGETLIENTGGEHVFDYAQGNILWRITSGKAALNLLAGAGWDFERDEIYVSAGGGPEYALTKNLHIFGDARAQKPVEGGDIHAIFRAGFRLSF